MRNAREMRISFRVELQGRLTPSVDDSPNHHGLLLLVYPVKVDGRAEIDRALPIVDLHREWAVVIRAIMIEDSLCLLHGLCCSNGSVLCALTRPMDLLDHSRGPGLLPLPPVGTVPPGDRGTACLAQLY